MAPIRIMTIMYDPDTDTVKYGVPGESLEVVNIFKRRYGMIGQKVSELGQSIQRREFPHFMSDKPYIHLIPREDLIEHAQDTSSCYCQCNPTVDVIQRVVAHHAMDGRPDYHEEACDRETWEVIDG